MIVQAMILICSIGALVLFGTKKYYKFGFIVGLCGQPFWFWTTWHAEQWGIFAGSIIYTCLHIKGMWTHWRKTCE